MNSKFISSDGKVKKYSDKMICELHKNDIVMVMSDVPNGKAMSKCLLIDANDTYTLNQRICALSGTKTPIFYLSQISRNKFYLKFDDGVSQTNLKKEDVLNCPIFNTGEEERKKISHFIELIDRRIKLQEQLVELLKKYKRGVIDGIFSGKISLSKDCPFDCWANKMIKDCLIYEQPQKYIVATEKYDDTFVTPVLTANKAFILGYTDEQNGIYNKGDVIIYDDFTMDMKFVDFNFKVKSSTIKMLTPTQGNDLYFMYSLLQSLNLQPEGHQRSYISKVESLNIRIPPYHVQLLISNFIKSIDDRVSFAERQLSLMTKQKQGILQGLFI